jgi:hypothetical protein
LARFWSRRPDRSCMTSCTRMFRDPNSSRTTISGILFPRLLTYCRTQRSSGREKVWKLTPSPPSRERSALTVALNPSAVDGTTINFSALSWVFRTQGQEATNQISKALGSGTPEIKMGVLLRSSPAGPQVLATWAEVVVPGGMPLLGPDMSPDIRLCAGSMEGASGHGWVRALGYGSERPTWQVRGDMRRHYSGVGLPALGGTELPASGGRFFARGFVGARSAWRGPSASSWALDGGLLRVARADSLVGFALSHKA